MTLSTPLASLILFFRTKRTLKFALVFCIGAVIGMLCIQFVPLHVDIQMRTMEKGSLQYFFDAGDGFNETQSRVVQLTDSSDFLHYRTTIQANKLRAIRVDPIETQGQFEILSLKVDYLIWHRQWCGQEELNYLVPSHDVEVKSTVGTVLVGLATGKDPSFITNDLEYFKRWQLIATIFSSVLGGVIAFVLLVVTRYFGGYKAILAYEHTPLTIIVLAGAMFRIIYWGDGALPSEASQLWTKWYDEGTYFSIAQYILTHGLRDYFFAEQSVMAAPANPLYIALVYTVLNSVNAIRAINLVISVLSIVIVYKLGKKVFNKPVGLLAAGICAVHGQLIQYSATLLTEPLFLSLFIASIYYLVLTLETQNLSRYRYQCYALASAVFLTGAILTRSIAMLLPVFLLAAIGSLEAYRSWRAGKPSFPLLTRAALPLFLPILIVGVIATKNYVFFDRFLVATGSGAALWLGSRADTEGDEPSYRGRTYDTNVITHGASHLTIQGDMLLMGAAKNNIRENLLGYAEWNVKKIGRLIVGNNFAWFFPHKNILDWYRASGEDVVATANMVFQIILASTIVVYGLIGLVATRGHESFGLIISASTCYLIVFSIPFLAIQRYGLPLVMLLVIPASSVMYGAWHAVVRLRRLALFGAPFALAIVLQVLLTG